MKRLRDTEASSRLLKNAHALLDAAPPLHDSRDRMLRVRSALDRPRARGGLLRVPAFAAAAGIALFGASAFAAVRIYAAIDRPAAESPSAPPSATPSTQRRKHAARQGIEQPAPATVVAVPEAEERAPAAEPRPAERRHAIHARARAPHASVEVARDPASSHAASRRRAVADPAPAHVEQAAAVQAPELPEVGEGSELVHRALKALRRDGDPALAARLLQEHRVRNPHGPLAEEALSLHIEAAVALRSPRAAALAREYLARYPHGRYASVAERALIDIAHPRSAGAMPSKEAPP